MAKPENSALYRFMYFKVLVKGDGYEKENVY